MVNSREEKELKKIVEATTNISGLLIKIQITSEANSEKRNINYFQGRA